MLPYPVDLQFNHSMTGGLVREDTGGSNLPPEISGRRHLENLPARKNLLTEGLVTPPKSQGGCGERSSKAHQARGCQLLRLATAGGLLASFRTCQLCRHAASCACRCVLDVRGDCCLGNTISL